MIALVRTSGTPEDRHKGLSQLIVDLRLPGVEIRPIRDLAGDEHFAEVFFDNVELDTSALIGEEGKGWQQVAAELAFERSGPERIYSSLVLLDGWRQHLRNSGRSDGTRSEEHTSELQSLMRISYAVFCLKKKKRKNKPKTQ